MTSAPISAAIQLAAAPFRFPIMVKAAHIDFMGHVNNAQYLSWVQDAVLAHWRSIAPPDIAAAHLWVALKHEITYRKPGFLDEELIANVILEKVAGARAMYRTIIERGEEVLAEISSSWCCIDAATRRPARITSNIAARFFTSDS